MIFWTWVIGLLATVLLVSGIDDLIPTLICLWQWLKRSQKAGPSVWASHENERRIAVFVPCWQESAVIEKMVRHNLAAIHYRRFDFFLGVYPNDEATVVAAMRLADCFQNVHVAQCPHPGPTSKADCLNWIFQRMLLFEEAQEIRFDTVVMHDAEDLIDPQAFALIHQQRNRYAMIQVPVLPLATPLSEWVHGVYCDDFAEYQTIDMPARQFSRSFIPSNGVGTAFGRDLLERLAQERGNRIFEPGSLTEDYECGVAVHQLGFSQLFAPVEKRNGRILATREYFPRQFWKAVRQRTRWIMGIALQSWERNGWRGPWSTKYWFWRDRKGLIAHPVSLTANILFLAGVIDWTASVMVGRPWTWGTSHPTVSVLCALTLWLQCLRIGLRMFCVSRIYGRVFALGVPIRSLYGNLINCLAAARALYGYIRSRMTGIPLAWLKTEHAYPNREALRFQKRDLAEILIGGGYVDARMLAIIQSKMPPDADLADFLVRHGQISEEDLCEAISLQSGVPTAYVDPHQVTTQMVRTLPAHIERKFRVLPFRLEKGHLFLASPQVPPPRLTEELRNFTPLPIEFRLVTWRNYEQLRSLLF